MGGRFRSLTAEIAKSRLWLGLKQMTHKTKEEFLVERHAYTSMILYEVTSDDLDQMEKETLSISEDFSFAVAATAVAISFSIALATTKIESIQTHDIFWIVMIIGYLAGFYFGIKYFRGRHKFRGIAKRIRERGGPLGQEGKEISASELANLITQPAPGPEPGEGRR